jgi:DNA replication licensing factor MCM5
LGEKVMSKQLETFSEMASGWDQGRIYATSVLPGVDQPASHTAMEQRFFDFVQQFHLNGDYLYRDQLRANLLRKMYVLHLQLGHVIMYDERIGQAIKDAPTEHLKIFEQAIQRHVRRVLYPNDATSAQAFVPECQIILESDANTTAIRDLDAIYVSRLVRVPGIVIAASSLSCKVTLAQIICKSCRHVKRVPVASGFSGLTLPRQCDSEPTEGNEKTCPMDPYVIQHDKCKFVDQQVLKLQEAPDMVPVGELPRHVLLYADRSLVNRTSPGSRVTVIGVYSIFQNKAIKASVAIRAPYIRVVGFSSEENDFTKSSLHHGFTDEQEEAYVQLSKKPHLYDMFAASIAPSIYGNQDIKKAIACLLFGGSKKNLPDGMRLRGDINVLLLGDPGVAKSQLLKFVEKVAPIAVYTSGKGSSAAGLTASVIRDPNTREFYLEGGAMVLADGGVVCIDEFDKMREEDRVAIHEAMEQQTISIAKAGITTILNSRTSVLAAANPVFGRYDDMKSPGDNIDFQTTILSRFDMIFIVRDEHNEQRDMTLARHVLNVHINLAAPELAEGEIDLVKMRGYIHYCRHKCFPRLTASAAESLSNHYVELRGHVRQLEHDMAERSSIPITIRQLEAVIRIAESLAKMELSPTATERHVEEAIRLFRISTLNAAQSGQVDGVNRADLLSQVRQVEQEVRRRLPIGSSISVRALRDDFVRQGYSRHAVDKTIQVMVSQETLRYRNQRLNVYRAGV